MYWLRSLWVLPVLAGAGCESMQQRLLIPVSLQTVAPIEIESPGLLEFGQPTKMGAWTLGNISKSGWETRCSQHLVSVDVISAQTYAFTVASREHTQRTTCQIKREARYLRFNDEPEHGHYSKLECTFHGSDGGKLLIDEDLPAGKMTGKAKIGTREWDFNSVHRGSNGYDVDPPLGYEIWSGVSAVAAIDLAQGGLTNDGRVWMDPALPAEDQQYVMSIVGAMLLFDPPAGYAWETCR